MLTELKDGSKIAVPDDPKDTTAEHEQKQDTLTVTRHNYIYNMYLHAYMHVFAM
jgi:hypothetical protein